MRTGRNRRPAVPRQILVIHGPNLNLLGSREPELYGQEALTAIDRRMTARARRGGVGLTAFQSNHEGALIDRVQAAGRESVDAIILNPGGFTHSSVSLRDALAAVAIPFIEVHVTNIWAREEFRQRSYFSSIAIGCITGLGGRGYDLALEYFLQA